MTAQSKTTIKSYFETGDKPTASQFVDFIDSYQDAGNYITTLTGDLALSAFVSGSSVATITSAAVTGAKIALLTIATGNIAAKAVTASLLGSGAALSGDVPVADGAGGVAYSTLTNSYYPNNGYATARYYHGFGYSSASVSMTVVASRLYWRPMVIGGTFTATKVGMKVTTLSAGNCRMGLYTMANGLPVTLVADFGTVSTGTTGEKEITISQALTPGVYAICMVFDATPGVDYCNGTNGIMDHFFGETNNALNDNGGYATFAYAALPSSFPANTAYTTNGSNPCNIWFKK